VRRYADVGTLISEAVRHYRDDVQQHQFPADEESYHLGKEAMAALLLEEGTRRKA
jgi:ketopantoate hydroxymethyltransferase